MGLSHHDRRWPALRLAAKRRDDWKCVACGSRVRLEVDHIKPARKNPELKYSLENLQTLCCACHARKTRIELGFAPLDTQRQQWRDLLKGKINVGKCENQQAAI